MNIGIDAQVRIALFEAGELVEIRTMKNFLTELGEAYIADRLSDRDETDGDIDAMAIGTGSGQTRTSTALATEVGTRATVTLDQLSGADDNDLSWVATFAAGNPATDQTITEGALFSKTTVSGSTMINYFQIDPGILKTSAQSLTITIIWTVGAS